MQMLRGLWYRIRWSKWFLALPEALQHPPGFYLLLAGVVVGIVLLVRFVGSRASFGGGLRREIRSLKRAGDFLSVGQRYETAGQNLAALDAYGQGGHWREHVRLLIRMGNRKRAKAAARKAEIWDLYGSLCRDDGEHLEAGKALQRAGKPHDAARCFETAGENLQAARCYTEAGQGDRAAHLLLKGQGRETAEALDAAIRKASGGSWSPELTEATRHAAELWVQCGEAERAYSVATASRQWEVAARVALEHLEPTAERAEVCLRAGERLAAAEIYKKMGEEQREAMCRAEHHQDRGESAEAAAWFEKAEAWDLAAGEWAASGESLRAADLYARVEQFAEAAKLYEAAGESPKAWAMEAAGQAHDPQSFGEEETTQREIQVPGTQAPTPGVATPGVATPGETTAVALPPDATLPKPATHERYVLEEEIGRGGMGVVYRAEDTMLKRRVAYKVVSTQIAGVDPTELLEEARAAARLSHPNIVQVYDAGQTQSGFFVVMELVEGDTLAHLLKKHRLSVRSSIAVGQQICAALHHAHQRRIVHRDLKPSNLMWTKENQIKLTDFGLARVFEDSIGKVMTRAAGTPYYMSPEQIRGLAVDPRSDIYSFGCVLYELLCQRAPFVGGDTIQQHLESQPEDPRRSRSEIPPALAGLVLQCLEKDPEKRPASAADVHRMLAAAAAAST